MMYAVATFIKWRNFGGSELYSRAVKPEVECKELYCLFDLTDFLRNIYNWQSLLGNVFSL